MNNYKRFTYPIAFSLACILSYYGIHFLLAWLAGIGGAFVAFLCYIVLWSATVLYLFLLAVPIYCFRYSSKVLPDVKRKFLFTLYNALVLAVSFLIVLHIEGENYLYALLLLVWAEISPSMAVRISPMSL